MLEAQEEIATRSSGRARPTPVPRVGRVRLLTFTTLYPDSVRPQHGIFVETRLRHLLASGEAESRVVAPVPWFPFSSRVFGSYGAFARVPRQETRNGVIVQRPRYLLLPKIGMTSAPFLMAAAAKPVLRKILESGYQFDAIDAHYFYPDGVAAAILGRQFGKPVVITARGTDISLVPQHAIPRRLVLWAAREASAMITVCQALADELVALGADATRVRTLRNGVDLALFRPGARTELRARLGLIAPTLLSVGHLIERKGHHLVIEAMRALEGMHLLVAGSGPMGRELKDRASALGVAERVRFIGALPQDTLRDYYCAADALVLASSREGWANVLLEAMACGTPVVASKVWGTPEVVASPEAGVLMKERSVQGVIDAVRRLFGELPDRAFTRRYAERFSWDDTTRGQLEVFSYVIASHRRAAK